VLIASKLTEHRAEVLESVLGFGSLARCLHRYREPRGFRSLAGLIIIETWNSIWNKVQLVRGARKLAFPGCWEWQGGRTGKGYGMAYGYLAHRLAWEFEHCPVPAGLCVLHRCDNRRCVRPDHLFLGTNTDNMQDTVSKRRAAGQRRGQQHPSAKLTDSDLAEIRARYRPRRNGQQLAREFGVSLSLIRHIVAGKFGRYAVSGE
jgi:hypothetical protein